MRNEVIAWVLPRKKRTTKERAKKTRRSSERIERFGISKSSELGASQVRQSGLRITKIQKRKEERREGRKEGKVGSATV